MSLRLFEFFGFSPADRSAAAQKFRDSKQCPFIGGQCIKRFRSGTISGACSLKPATSGPVICCPNRMYAEGYKILQDVAHECFGKDARLCHSKKEMVGDGNDVQVFGKRWGKELRLPNRGSGGSYFVDWILAHVDADQNLKEFVAVEVQTMDTSGSYEAEVDAYNRGEVPAKASEAGINWENVSKRILPQIIYKGHVLRREPMCSKGLFFVCPSPVYKRIMTRLGGNLAGYHLQPGTVTFRWYDLGEEPTDGESRSLDLEGQQTTTIDQVALAFTSPSNLPAPQVYEKAIRAELKAQ